MQADVGVAKKHPGVWLEEKRVSIRAKPEAIEDFEDEDSALRPR